MSHPKDLRLDFIFTDRGGNDVYNIRRERLSTPHNAPKIYDSVGEMRIGPDRKIRLIRWGKNYVVQADPSGK